MRGAIIAGETPAATTTQALLWWQAFRLPFEVAVYLISAPADVVRSVGC